MCYVVRWLHFHLTRLCLIATHTRLHILISHLGFRSLNIHLRITDPATSPAISHPTLLVPALFPTLSMLGEPKLRPWGSFPSILLGDSIQAPGFECHQTDLQPGPLPDILDSHSRSPLSYSIGPSKSACSETSSCNLHLDILALAKSLVVILGSSLSHPTSNP